MDVAALEAQREDEVVEDVPIFGAAQTGSKVAHVAAEAGEILAQKQAFATGGPKVVVERAVEQRIADRGGQAVAGGVAQIAAGKERIAGRRKRAGAVGIGEEIGLAEADLVIVQAVA